MKYSIIIVFALVICSCQSKPTAPKDSEGDYDCGTDSPMYDNLPADGIIIGEGVRLRQDSSIQSREMARACSGEMLTILAKSETKDTLKKGDACEVYPMLQVKRSCGDTGWVSGKFVFRILENHEKTIHLDTFRFDNRTFQLMVCRNYGIRSGEEEGPTGCWDFLPVLLYDINSREAYLVETAMRSHFKFWSLEVDKETTEWIEYIKVEQQQLIANIYAEQAERCNKYGITIVNEDGFYSGSCYRFQTFDKDYYKRQFYHVGDTLHE